MKTISAVVSVPLVTGLALLIGWAIHGSGFEQVLPYYLFGGLAVGIAASLVISRERMDRGREANDFIELVAVRDSRSASFRDVVTALLVSAVVFSFFDSTRVLAALSSGVAVLAIIDALIRQRQLNSQYGSPDA